MSQGEIKSISDEAEEHYQQGLSFDFDAKKERPDLIRADLRERKSDTDEAKRFYALAAKQGHPKAMNNLANMLATDPYANPEEIEAAFGLYRRLAEMGDYRGHFGMGGTLLRGFLNQPPDELRGTQCIERAAIMAGNNDLEPALALASLDLNTQLALAGAQMKPLPRIERGLALMEDGILGGNSNALNMMVLYYTHRAPNGLKAEYYARHGASAGLLSNSVPLDGNYRVGNFGPPNPEMAACAKALSKDQLPEIETLCPRPDGELTREKAGLPPAPTEPLNIKAYLQKFRLLHPDL